MMLGTRIGSEAKLLWARALLGEDGDRLLWDALVAHRCFGENQELLARPTADFLCALWEPQSDVDSELLWTLPSGLAVPGIETSGYAEHVLRLIENAQRRLLLVAPFLEARGIGRLQTALLDALARNVSVTLVTQDAGTPGSWASNALESLRQEARGLVGALQVYTAAQDAEVLLHSKLVVSDLRVACVGSANLTDKALAHNLETGVLVGSPQAIEIQDVVQKAIEARLVTLVFSNEAPRG